ncbi:alpha/beta hydrolase [Bradyrhizobium sp. INPA01-394B]|uniref:Alpha/beta hydrolase n=1 Tax=Bradyrhizobium campsiandrae TaxID=1729892 RepID=A0ABR7UKC9_9BRAD|nr:alpha/beta hydrolase [Bradyrhizobium campsiandrae]MBC9883781.1 alpha/beta hydrolase [Bradyrhizobium campsiandrae]MBC9984551.1 alpha/beta hydrolase [Bradyrhizobium campsiandrae]
MSKVFHVFTPGADPVRAPLLLMHGTGGTELDLLPLAGDLSPEASTLSVRGTVAGDGGFAFFHRHPDRTVDETDITERASILADVIETCRSHHGFAAPIAVGFSNGAIMAAMLLLTRPGLLGGAILFRPLSPLSKDLPARMHGVPVLIIDGQNDTRRSRGDGLTLAGRLTRSGAAVTHHVLDAGHAITSQDRQIARDWLARTIPM